MPTAIHTRIWLAMGGVLALGLLALCAVVLWPRPNPFLLLPVPNAYDDLMRASQDAQAVGPADLEKASADALHGYVEANRASLERTQAALKHESVVTLDFSSGGFTRHIDRTQNLRRLLRLLQATALLAEREGRAGDAAALYLDIIRLGPALARGGTIMDLYLGVACEGVGIRGMSRLHEQLDAAACRKTIAALLATDPLHEPLEPVFARDRTLAENSLGWTTRIPMALMATQMQRLRQPAEDASRASSLVTQALRHLLVIQLAIQAYHLERGELPKRLDDLVPAHLASIPLDPFTNQPPIYRPEGGHYLLYSVGPDRTDDGGKAHPRGADPAKSKGDYQLEDAPGPPP